MAQILDLGCGDGAIVWWLQQQGYTQAQGIDISEELVGVTERLGVANVHKAEIQDFLTGKDEMYSLIVARNILEHFEKQEVVDILLLCHRSLQSEGVLLVQVPNAESPFGSRLRYADFTHELAFTASSLSQVMKVAGFGRVDCYPVEPVVRGAKSLVRSLLWKLVEVGYKLLLLVELGQGHQIVTQNITAVARK